ncbi:MAG: type III pantothenate kinase [bacterium]|nr:type III pantothenate kinase [bacterium]
MLLAADIGNTNTAIGLYDGERLAAHWRLTTAPDRTDDELEIWLRSLLELEDLTGADVSGAAISSVVPAITTAFRKVAGDITAGDVVVIGPGIRTGMIINIDNPHEVGADRVVNAVAARERYGAPCVVVDFGTSTNFDVVGPSGDYLGGSIAPGLVIATNALIAGAAALRNVEFKAPPNPIGKGTVEAIQSGAIYGHAGLVDGITERLAAQVGGDVTRVATGGLASTVVPYCESVSTIDEYLTLDGLRMIYEMNRS